MEEHGMATGGEDADVIIVGARAAGAATAMLLARAGLSVLVVDRTQPGSDTLSTHALMRGGVLQLARWGLLPRVVAAGTPPIRRTTFRYGHGDVAIDIKPSPGVDALYAPRRTVLDPIIADAAARAGATIEYGVTMTALRRDRHGRIAGIDVRDAAGMTSTRRAPLIIGADGRSSAVARHVGAMVTHAARATSAFVYGYWPDLDTDGYEWAYRRGVMAGFIPTNGGQTCVFVGGTPQRVGRGGWPVVDELLRHTCPEMSARLHAAGAPQGLRTFTGQPGHLRQAWGPGWALVGDAGSWKDPASAHGLTDALRDAELLAPAVLAVARGEASESDAFGAYQATRDRLTLPLLHIADEIAGYGWDDDRIVELLQAMNTVMGEELDTIAGFDGTSPAPGALEPLRDGLALIGT